MMKFLIQCITLSMQERQWEIASNTQVKKKEWWRSITENEQLYYLINGVLDGSYQVKTFCSEFTRVYDLEVDYGPLSELENKEFGDLCEMAGRFSDDEEELKIPNVFFSGESILNKAEYVKQLLE